MKNILMGLIRFYRKNISPNTPPSCRYHPTCSAYGLEAIDKHGALKGGLMSTARIIRCNPFVDGGVDEVPDFFTLKRNPDNIDDIYIPAQMMQPDTDVLKKLEALYEKYQDQLIIADDLPAAKQVLTSIADVSALNEVAIKRAFSEDELDYLMDIEIIPELPATDFDYYLVEDTPQNAPYLTEIDAYLDDSDLGQDFPLVVLEETGIWYSNVPTLAKRFLVERGVAPADIENRSYHLWIVLQALDDLAKDPVKQ